MTPSTTSSTYEKSSCSSPSPSTRSVSPTSALSMKTWLDAPAHAARPVERRRPHDRVRQVEDLVVGDHHLLAGELERAVDADRVERVVLGDLRASGSCRRPCSRRRRRSARALSRAKSSAFSSVRSEWSNVRHRVLVRACPRARSAARCTITCGSIAPSDAATGRGSRGRPAGAAGRRPRAAGRAAAEQDLDVELAVGRVRAAAPCSAARWLTSRPSITCTSAPRSLSVEREVVADEAGPADERDALARDVDQPWRSPAPGRLHGLDDPLHVAFLDVRARPGTRSSRR